MRLDVDVRVVGEERFLRRFDLRSTDIPVLVEYLALQVGEVDGVVLHDADGAHSGQREVDGDG